MGGPDDENGTVNVKVRVHEYANHPYGFAVDVLRAETRYVMMKDGKIYIPGGPEFSNEVAKTFAEQNNGLFFPKREEGKTYPGFSFNDFINALKILIIKQDKYQLKRESENIQEFYANVAKAKKASDLIPDCRHLNTVQKDYERFDMCGMQLGIGGIVSNEHGEKECFSCIGTKQQYLMELSLIFSETFARKDFDIIGRKVTANLPLGSGLTEYEINGISEFAKAKKMTFSYEPDADKPINGRLIWQSPSFDYEANVHNLKTEKSPVESGLEMIVEIQSVVDGILKFNERQAKRKEQEKENKMKDIRALLNY